MQCVENRIDVERFRFSEAGRRRLRELHGVSHGQRIVALVGRLDPIKGHTIFMRAAAAVAAERGDVVFWCVGGGNSNLKGSLQALAAELGMSDRLTWLGDVAEMPEVYSAADLVVSASLSEGFPNTVCEALVCGTPVIGTEVGDTARIVEGGGRCIAAGDASALAAAILEWLGRPSPDRSTIRQNFLLRFDPTLLLQRHEALLGSVVTSKHGS
jgi:glycosyltransferase involved in cell wall biosynthesis